MAYAVRRSPWHDLDTATAAEPVRSPMGGQGFFQSPEEFSPFQGGMVSTSGRSPRRTNIAGEFGQNVGKELRGRAQSEGFKALGDVASQPGGPFHNILAPFNLNPVDISGAELGPAGAAGPAPTDALGPGGPAGPGPLAASISPDTFAELGQAIGGGAADTAAELGGAVSDTAASAFGDTASGFGSLADVIPFAGPIVTAGMFLKNLFSGSGNFGERILHSIPIIGGLFGGGGPSENWLSFAPRLAGTLGGVRNASADFIQSILNAKTPEALETARQTFLSSVEGSGVGGFASRSMPSGWVIPELPGATGTEHEGGQLWNPNAFGSYLNSLYQSTLTALQNPNKYDITAFHRAAIPVLQQAIQAPGGNEFAGWPSLNLSSSASPSTPPPPPPPPPPAAATTGGMTVPGAGDIGAIAQGLNVPSPGFLSGAPTRELGIDESVRLHEGGVVPGRPGQEVPATLKAGETVLPTGFDSVGSHSGQSLHRLKSLLIKFAHEEQAEGEMPRKEPGEDTEDWAPHRPPADFLAPHEGSQDQGGDVYGPPSWRHRNRAYPMA